MIQFSVAEVLGAMIAQNSILEELHLSNCGMGTRELRPIIDALPRNNKLKKYVFSILSFSILLLFCYPYIPIRLYLDINKLSKESLLSVLLSSNYVLKKCS